jgi:hypothetical protein
MAGNGRPGLAAGGLAAGGRAAGGLAAGGWAAGDLAARGESPRGRRPGIGFAPGREEAGHLQGVVHVGRIPPEAAGTGADADDRDGAPAAEGGVEGAREGATEGATEGTAEGAAGPPPEPW